MSETPALIALDWGTSSLRAYLLDAQARPLATLTRPYGIVHLPDGGFDAALRAVTESWLNRYGPLPALACGMIGSRQGWQETPYLACPIDVGAIGQALLAVRTMSATRDRVLHIVSGLSITDHEGVPDVMRGEETQIIGALAVSDHHSGMFVLPGTHSKWVRVDNHSITGFASFISGELFAVLCEHSILGRLMEGKVYDSAAFQRGLHYACSNRAGGLLKRLFSARSLGLFQELPGTALRSYLSGLIIGTEIKEGLDYLPPALRTQPITLIGDAELSARYSEALTARGLQVRQGPEHAAAIGLFHIAQKAHLLID